MHVHYYVLLTLYKLDGLISVHLFVGLSNPLLHRVGRILGEIPELALQFSRVNILWSILVRRIQDGLPLRLCLSSHINHT